MKSNVDLRVVHADILVRIIFGPTIFLAPVLTTIVNIFIDWGDGELFKQAGLTHNQYSVIDKALDLYWLVWIVLYLINQNVPSLLVFLSLFFIRLIGQTLYFATNKVEFFFFFPNIFEMLFYVYALSLVFPSLTITTKYPIILGTVLITTPLVLFREWILHVKKMNLSWMLMGKTTRWVED